MNTEAELEKELMTNLHNLSGFQDDEFKILIAMYTKQYKSLQKQKEIDFEESIKSQIKFYGRNYKEYLEKINKLVQKYSSFIEQIIIEYNTRFIAIMNEIYSTQSNQKIAIANMKLSLELKSKQKYDAVNLKRNNYEIVLQESFRQIELCPFELKNKINKIFYNRKNQIAIKKYNIFQKIINLFSGKKNIEIHVFDALEMELKKLEEVIIIEISKINIETIRNIAIIKNAQMQTQNIYNNMIKNQ